MSHNTLSKIKAREIKGLSSKKERDRQGLFIVEGYKGVVDSIGKFDGVYLIASIEWLQDNNDIIKNFSGEILVSDKRGLEIISSMTSVPEVIAVFRKSKNETLPVIKKDKLYVLLDEVQDPGNLGTIIRTCDWFGIYEIFASKNTADVYSPKVVQSSMGSLTRVKVHYLDLYNLICSNQEIPVLGTLLVGQPVNTYNGTSKGFLLLGNEGRGISPELRELINVPLTIPPVNLSNHPDSLNVGVAAAIILSQLVFKR